MEQLIKNDGKEIHYLFHVSDIHIRNTQRHEEYEAVFQLLYRKLRKDIKKDKSLIVITGDVMHSKTELSPESIDMASRFFDTLTAIAPVILIAGNHDCNLSNNDRLDALTPIVKKLVKKKNLFYLKYSGVYVYNNIHFGVSSLLDKKITVAKQIVYDRDLVYHNKYKIGLYHGMLRGARLDNGLEPRRNNLTVADFDGYDYVLLGDIHQHQIVNSSGTIAYAGSLIQQSHGESITGHGFLRWDLDKHKIILSEINNDHGYCTLYVKEGKIINSDRIGKMGVNNLVNMDDLPKNPTIRFMTEATSNDDLNNIIKDIKTKFNLCGYSNEQVFTENASHKNVTVNIDNIYNEDVKMMEIRKFLAKKNIKDDDTITDILELHKKIEQKTGGRQIGSPGLCWNILRLEFSNMMSYGDNNVIDFRNYDSNKIIGIFAQNHYGKSAIIDIILFCLFDKCTRGERRDIINKNKNSMHCSLLFTVGNNTYLIERNGNKKYIRQRCPDSKFSLKIDVKLWKITFNDLGMHKEQLTGIDKNSTNKLIIEIVGNYDDYLTSAIYIQQFNRHSNFLDMTHLQKKEYIHNILHLDIFDRCLEYSKEKVKKYSVILKEYEKNRDMSRQIEQVKKDIYDSEKKIIDMEYCKNYWIGILKCMETYASSIGDPIIIKYRELCEYSLLSLTEIDNTIDNLLEERQQHILNSKSNGECDDMYIIENRTAAISREIVELAGQIERLKKSIKCSVPDIPIDILISRKHDYCKELDLLTARIETTHQYDIIAIRKKHTRLISELHLVSEDRANEVHILTEQLKKNFLSILREYQTLSDSVPLFEEQYLKKSINVMETFKSHVCLTKELLLHCPNNEVLELQDKWLEKYNKWKQKVADQLSGKSASLTDLFSQYSKILKILHHKTIDTIVYYNNKHLQNEIDYLEGVLNKINDAHESSAKVEVLKQKIKFTSEQIEAVNALRKIEVLEEDMKSLIVERDNLELEKMHKSKYTDSRLEGLDHKLRLLENYRFNFCCYTLQRNSYDKTHRTISDISHIITQISSDISQENTKLMAYQSELQTIVVKKEKHDSNNNKMNLHKLYCSIMDYNGVPYEILKKIVPNIEFLINSALSNIVEFTVKFSFLDSNNEVKKTKIGTIDIDICYANQEPYNVQLASGFEKFIISLMLRIVLCELNKAPKPNFFIVDEGWSCLDKENLSNVNMILDYIRERFDHVIIISHLDELKNGADYTINISKKNGHSYVNNIYNVVLF